MNEFSMSRANVFTTWTHLHGEHGIGYTLSENVITPALPENVTFESLFGERR